MLFLDEIERKLELSSEFHTKDLYWIDIIRKLLNDFKDGNQFSNKDFPLL